MMQRILLVSLLEMRMLKIAPKEVSISVAYPDLVKSFRSTIIPSAVLPYVIVGFDVAVRKVIIVIAARC